MHTPRNSEELFKSFARDIRDLKRYVRTSGAAGAAPTLPSSGTSVATTALGMTGSVSALRQGDIVLLYSNLSGTPTDPLPVTLATLPLGFRPITEWKGYVGGSSTLTTAIRMVGISTTGVITLVSLTTGTGVWMNGVSYVAP